MGYYTEIVSCDCVIEEKNYAAAFKALVELNNRNDLKSGGRHPKPISAPADEPHDEPHDAVWFSLMPWNYHETLCSVVEILEELRFGVLEDITQGMISIETYEGSSGDEMHFFRVLAPFINPGSFIQWRGWDDYHYRWEFDGKEMHEFEGEVVWRPV